MSEFLNDRLMGVLEDNVGKKQKGDHKHQTGQSETGCTFLI